MSTQTLLDSHSSIELKGGMFTLTTVHLIDFNLEELAAQLDDKIKQAPNFFQYAPIILDLQRLRPQTASFDFQILIHTLRSKKLIPIGVRGASKALKEAAIQSGLAIFPEEKILANKKRSSAPEIKREYATPSRGDTASITTGGRLITQPVRSGQQIYAQGGDLVVVAPVSHGAELLADGHIHVYGTMRGRALAGVMGNAEAMIFCRSLEAELVSIAGQYRLSEDLKESCWKESACIQLQEGRLHIRPI